MRIKKRLRSISVVRLVRMVLGAMALVQSFLVQDILLLTAGSVLVLMGILNVGCFGNRCTIAPAKDVQAKQS